MMESGARGDAKKRPAVFFDRDGTLIDDIGYLGDPAGVAFYDGVPKSLKRLQDSGYLLVVLTNQSGIGRGYFTEETALSVNLAMLGMLAEEGVCLSAVYYCPHHPDENCSCRKPELLMVQRALTDLPIDGSRSWMVGDTDKDVWTGLRGGLRPILVETGKPDKGNLPPDVQRCGSVVEAVRFVLEGETA